MNNTNQSNPLEQTQSSHKQILGGMCLTLVVAASLVALWRGSFVSALNADMAANPNDISTDGEQEQAGNTSAVILVPEQVSTIQGAIDQAAEGAVIFVAPGEYRENIRVARKNISLQSIGGAANTFILGDGLDGPIAVIENSKFMFDGFRIQDGQGKNGHGMVLQGSNATIRNCQFKNNMGGVCVTTSKAQFDHCEITQNRSAVAGGGMWSTQSDVRMSDCKVNENAAGTCGGGVYALGGSMQLFNVAFLNNRVKSGAWGGGLYSDRANVNLNACVMQGNFSHESGSAMYVLDASATIRASTFKNNSFTGAATVVGANAHFDIQDSVLETAEETVAAARDEAAIEMAQADDIETGALMMAVK
ncbi:MAG: hypothetical protein EXS12_07740 [Phycisphaerales bacterium]|nr:hypothetical protein [Phycisphaerales bacterium]